MIKELETNRLILRRFALSDVQRMSEINSCEEVMRFFPKIYTFEDTLKFIKSVMKKYENNDLAVYACVSKLNNTFIGSVGITYHNFKSFFTPCYEVGWRLDKQYWNQGYATEAAKGVLNYGLIELCIDEIVSYSPVINTASIRVMQKIGMKFYQEYFNHTLWDKNSPLSKHILYRITREEYLRDFKK